MPASTQFKCSDTSLFKILFFKQAITRVNAYRHSFLISRMLSPDQQAMQAICCSEQSQPRSNTIRPCNICIHLHLVASLAACLRPCPFELPNTQVGSHKTACNTESPTTNHNTTTRKKFSTDAHVFVGMPNHCQRRPSS